MLYREMKIEDVPKIAALERACFSDPWSEQMLLDGIASPFFLGFVAEEAGEPIGYAFGSAVYGNAELMILAVAVEHRRRGIGKKLLALLEDGARKRSAKSLSLEVRVSNVAAMSLYERCGFLKTYVRTKYYADGEDAVIMEKGLGG